MSGRDWFRKRSWTPADQADFFARLERARADKRPQYLRIQAVHLEEVGNCEAALQLLDLLVSQYPESGQISIAQHQRARCLEVLGRADDAEAAYRASLRAARQLPSVDSDSHVDFAHFAIRQRRVDLYEEALAALDEFSTDMIFPAQVYMYSAAKALILARTGRESEARMFARRALEESEKGQSGLRYHPDLGLVKRPDRQIQSELKRLAGHTRWPWAKA